MKKLGVAVFCILFLLLAVVAGVHLNIVADANTPAGTGSVERTVLVRSGQGFKALSVMLYNKGLILHPLKFRLFARIHGYDKHIKAGEYMLSNAMTPEKILQIMEQGISRVGITVWASSSPSPTTTRRPRTFPRN